MPKTPGGRTYDWYRDHIQSFLNALPGAPSLLVADLKPFHVIEWADKHPDRSNAYRWGAIVAIQRPFNWAEELGYIPASPVKKIKKPQPQRRESHIPPEDVTAIAGRYAETDPFRDLLEFAWHPGCRPQEARHIEARHVHLDAECVIIPKEEVKGKRRARVILLHGRALEIIRRLLAIRREGKLFVNEDGKPWKRFAIANRFDRLHLAPGIETLKEQGILILEFPTKSGQEVQGCAVRMLLGRRTPAMRVGACCGRRRRWPRPAPPAPRRGRRRRRPGSTPACPRPRSSPGGHDPGQRRGGACGR